MRLSYAVTSVKVRVCEKSDVSKVCGFQRKGNRHDSSDGCWLMRSDQRRRAAECKSRQDFNPRTRDFLQTGRQHKQELSLRWKERSVDGSSCQNTTGAPEADD
jgi:hypothetical protein